MEQIEWGQILATLITVGGTLVLGRWAWSKLPKRDMGSAALTTVQAAEAAVTLMDVVTEARLQQLEERVDRLEEELAAKNEKITALEREIRRLLAWIAALIEQISSLGQEPVTLDEIRFREDGHDSDFRRGS